MKRSSFAQPSRARAILLALAAIALLAMAMPAFAQPAHVIVRLPTGAQEPAQLSDLLSSWRQSGHTSNITRIDSNQEQDPAFSTMILLEFPSEGSYQAWEREESAKLVAPLVFQRADLLAKGEITPRDSNRSVYKVNLYQPTVSFQRYKEFVDGYITPLMEGQRAAKILVGYWMYVERGASAQSPGQSILVLEYRDSVAFEQATPIKVDIRERLTANHPTYPKFHDIKADLRLDLSGTMAKYTEIPPPQLPNLPSYKPEHTVVGGLRIVGSDLKNAVPQLAAEFAKFHPAAKITTSNIPSSEGGIAALYLDASDVAPMGDDAKITDMMPFYNTFGYMPTEISVATGGYEKRGSLFAWAVVVHKDNPLEEISVDELKRVFGAERTGGWELVDNNYLYTSKFARSADSNIRTWGQLGLRGEYAQKEIQTFGYISPGFATYFERNWFHWSKKWNPNFRDYVEEKQSTPDAAGKVVTSTHALELLSRDRFSIGLAALMHVKNYPDVKVLRISHKKGGEAIPLTPENVANRTYPLIRDAFFYINKRPDGYIDPKVKEFMRFVLSREGQEIIARVGYYYPLTAEYLREQLKKLD